MTRNILAIDTSGSFCSVALATRGGGVASRVSAGTGDHFEQLPRLVEALCGECGVTPRDLDEIRIGVGPGSFTGLRIGMSFAKGLSWSLRVPLVGCPSFAAVAAAACARDSSVSRVVVLADARRDEVFIASYRKGAGVIEEVSPRIEPVTALGVAPWFVEGGEALWVTPQSGLVVPGRVLREESQGALGMLRLAPVALPFTLEGVASLEPTYLREVAAKTIEERRVGP